MATVTYQLPAGTVVGNRYRIERILGEGGYGITYYAMDLRLDLPVAIKEFFPAFWVSRYSEKTTQVQYAPDNYQDFEKGIMRFYEEATTLAHLYMIPEIVLVRDFFRDNNTAYLVMEYLDGKNLKQMTDGFGGRIPPHILMSVMDPLIKALAKVHAKDMIHRDISPDNIMMLENGNTKLLDFGNARDTSDNKSMTLAMKEGFAAPEQYRSKGQGTWTDVYGVCATIYYCLTGKLPMQAMERLTGGEFLTPTQLGVDLPKHQEDAIMQGLDLFVRNRIQNMEELWERLYVAPVQQSSVYQQSESTIQEPITTILTQSTETDGKLSGICSSQELRSEPQHIGYRDQNVSFKDICIHIFRKLKDR